MTTSTHAADTSTDGARIDTTRDAMQQALEALEAYSRWAATIETEMQALNAIAVLRAALAEQAQPVAWAEQIVEHLTALHNTEMIRELDSGDALIRLDDAIAAVDEARDRYTTPPAPQSLRDLCAAAYQVVGVADGPVEMLDNLWAAAEGKPLPHDPGAGLPWSQPSPQPLTDKEILSAVGWERAEMYMKLLPNFPVDEAKQETMKNARAVEAEVLKRVGVQR